jgi:hypothetical protein
VITYVGKGDALTKLGRLDEAEEMLRQQLRSRRTGSATASVRCGVHGISSGLKRLE